VPWAYAFIKAHRKPYRVKVMRRVLGVTPSDKGLHIHLHTLEAARSTAWSCLSLVTPKPSGPSTPMFA
jgi:hypothetical protein